MRESAATLPVTARQTIPAPLWARILLILLGVGTLVVFGVAWIVGAPRTILIPLGFLGLLFTCAGFSSRRNFAYRIVEAICEVVMHAVVRTVLFVTRLFN